MISGALLPAWIVVPIAAALMLITGTRINQLATRRDMPASRRRIRIASTTLILAIIPFVALGVSVINPDADPRRWTFVWLTTLILLAMAILLAVVDICETVRLFVRHRRRIRRMLSQEDAE